MTSLASSNDTPESAASVLSPTKIVILAAFATVVWFLAALFIRFAGPSGIFQGPRALILFALTIPATIPLNMRCRKLVRLSKRHMVSVIAVTSATATMWDGIAMTQFPSLYGGDPVVTGAGAAWLLWAIGVAGALSLITVARASD